MLSHLQRGHLKQRQEKLKAVSQLLLINIFGSTVTLTIGEFNHQHNISIVVMVTYSLA